MEKGEQRRSEIVEGLLEVMAATGYAGATVQAIARAANLTPGLVHYHFRTKQDVLLALIAALSDRLQERLARLDAAASSSAEGGMAAVDRWIDAHLALGEGADGRAVACWVQIGAEALHQPAVREAYSAVLAADAAELRARLRGAGIAAAEVEAAVGGVMAAVQGAYQLSLSCPALIPTGTAADTVRRMAAGLA